MTELSPGLYASDIRKPSSDSHFDVRDRNKPSESTLGCSGSASSLNRYVSRELILVEAKWHCRATVQYELIIRQQPIAARACGFGERDRRAIDPPPILELIVRDPHDPKTKLPEDHECLDGSVIYCELWSAEADLAEAHIPEVGARRQQRRLVGGLVASPFIGVDEFNIKGCFFPFPDLSCRTTGSYRLKFTLVIVNSRNLKLGDRLPFRAHVISDIFEVYTAKSFPGMIESTVLTKSLKRQGCLITVKKGHQRFERKRTAFSGEENNDEEGDGEDDEVDMGQGKRQRTTP